MKVEQSNLVSANDAALKNIVSAIVICTDRLQEAIECIASLDLLGDLLGEALLLKNAPKEPWPENAFDHVSQKVRGKLRIVESEERVFPTTGRNRLASIASGDIFLFLDDDSLILSRSGIVAGVSILKSDPAVGSIAFPQSTKSGEVSASAQPAPVNYPCYACGFMTCAALVKASVYRELGGFQELLQMAHEENEFCKRQWDLGLAVVYLPMTCIAHEPTPTARNSSQRFMLNARNSWYQAVLHEPLWLLAITIAPRFIRAIQYLRHSVSYVGGNWISLYFQAIRGFLKDLPYLVINRRALKIATFRKWQRMKTEYPAYRSFQG
ncbi:hypothetical protein Poly24_00440 [Rosistilla carotiformis]|uniref:Glycosyl transferase family 2 n=1 Tax=Rosistilla carotiformis TaxID=2528017 RepID=A0A518JLD6_9BACT|nr:glycosyltransferase [Rosistilla carotiformis]QDV66360.1 hypothetical protein Poly24_00440 [Rosistilla carotiformis]